MIVEALGQGKQTIIVRNYDPAVKISYYILLDIFSGWWFLSQFKQDSRDFVEKMHFPKEGRTEIKYYVSYKGHPHFT